jgi:hypothetical protein
MVQFETRVVKANKREVPNQLPILAWMDRVEAYVAQPDILAELPWYDPVIEYLRPDEMLKLKAKALVWAEETGALPKDISVWWEVRMGRRRGDVPPMAEIAVSTIDDKGVLHCGYCKARWSANFDGSPHPFRCKLCDRIFVIEKELQNGYLTNK